MEGKELNYDNSEPHIHAGDHELLLERRESTSTLCQSRSSSSSGKDVDDNNNDDGSQPRNKVWRNDALTYRHRKHSTTRIQICAAITAVLLLTLLSIATTVAFYFLDLPARSAPTTATDIVVASQTKTSSGLAPTISCKFRPSLQQQQDGECVFDPILLAWMPRPCVNFALLRSTLNTTSEISRPPYEIAGAVADQVYADEGLTRRLPSREVRRMEQNPYYVTLRFHRAHCAYMFRLVSEAAGRRALLDGTMGVEEVVGRDGDAGFVDGDDPREVGGVYVWQEALRPMHVDHCVKVLAWRDGDLDHAEKFYASAGRCVLL